METRMHYTVFEVKLESFGVTRIMDLDVDKISDDDLRKLLENQEYKWRTDINFNTAKDLTNFLSRYARVGRVLNIVVEYWQNQKGESEINSYYLEEKPSLLSRKSVNHKMDEVKRRQEQEENKKRNTTTNSPILLYPRTPAPFFLFAEYAQQPIYKEEQEQIIFPSMSVEDGYKKLEENEECNWLLSNSSRPYDLTIHFFNKEAGRFQTALCMFDTKKGWLIDEERRNFGTSIANVTNENFSIYKDSFFKRIQEKFGLQEASMLKPNPTPEFPFRVGIKK